jgi:hypothetical protein
MADVTRVTAAIRAVEGAAHDVYTADAASGYTPVVGDLVAIAGNDTVDECDATDANGLVQPVGIVESFKAVRTTAGGAGYRVTCRFSGVMEGFTSLTAKTVLFNSTTAGAIADADPTTTGVTGIPIGIAINTTQVLLALPCLTPYSA